MAINHGTKLQRLNGQELTQVHLLPTVPANQRTSKRERERSEHEMEQGIGDRAAELPPMAEWGWHGIPANGETEARVCIWGAGEGTDQMWDSHRPVRR
jgi:hypothetical protein